MHMSAISMHKLVQTRRLKLVVHRKNGFTLIEILVSISIIALLMALIFRRFRVRGRRQGG